MKRKQNANRHQTVSGHETKEDIIEEINNMSMPARLLLCALDKGYSQDEAEQVVNHILTLFPDFEITMTADPRESEQGLQDMPTA